MKDRRIVSVSWVHLSALTKFMSQQCRKAEALEKKNASLCRTLEEWRDDAHYYKGLAFELDRKLKKLMGLDVKLKARRKLKGKG